MNLRAHLFELIAPLAAGDEALPGVALVRLSTEVGLWLAFSAGDREVLVEVAPLGPGRFAARTARFAISYRSRSGAGHVDPQLGLRLCRVVAERVASNEERLAVASAGEPSRAAPRVREVRVERLLEPGSGFYKLSPYAGCLIGCRYCYAQTPLGAQRRLEALPEVPWGSYVDVRINAAEVLAGELATLAPRPIKFCPILSDPYQAVESRFAITRACLEVLARAGAAWPTLLLTRSTLVLRDLELLATLPGAWVGASIPTIDDTTRAHFEPRAASIPERLDVLARFRAAGVRTFAVVQPLLSGSIDALADALAASVTSVSIDVLRGEEQAASDFDDPRYRASRDEAWQRSRASELARALAERDVAVWDGELPPGL